MCNSLPCLAPAKVGIDRYFKRSGYQGLAEGQASAAAAGFVPLGHFETQVRVMLLGE